MSHKIVILGAGPLGISAAYAFKTLNFDNFQIFEKKPYIGGLCHTFIDEKKFLWDIGGHVVYSNDDSVNNFLDKIMGKDWVYHLKESFIRIEDFLIPYPFQNNLHKLSKELSFKCVTEFINRQKKVSNENFLEWLYSVFGKGITDIFMRPYNEKLWNCDLKDMGTYWTKERISIPFEKEIIKNLIFNKTDSNFGCDNKFRYPLKNGVGEIFKRASNYFKENLHINKNAVKIDSIERKVYFDDNTSFKYDYLISSMPITEIVNILNGNTDLKNAALNLKHNSVAVFGLGFNKPPHLKFSWMYFPEKKYPFYRVSNYSNYSPNNVENHEKQFSLLTESAYKNSSIISKTELKNKVIEGLKDCKIIDKFDEENIISEFFYNIDCAYPIPTKDRDIHLNYINSRLEQLNIFSRGRFGGFKYEKSNIESTIKEGFSITERILRNKSEKVF